jgi:hypothetical protein
VWLEIFHPDPKVDLPNEFYFALGRALEIKLELSRRDEQAINANDHQLVLIEDLP